MAQARQHSAVKDMRKAITNEGACCAHDARWAGDESQACSAVIAAAGSAIRHRSSGSHAMFKKILIANRGAERRRAAASLTLPSRAARGDFAAG